MRKVAFLGCLFTLLAANALATWQKVPTKSFGWFKTIEFSDSNNGWIGGAKGVLLRTSNGGKEWKVVKSFTKDSILDIHFPNPYEGWALCERNIYQLGNRNASYIMRTVDGGKTWKREELENAGRIRLKRLAFSKNGNALALGEMGSVFSLDEKARWKKLISPTTFLINSGAFADEKSGAIVGGGGVILFTDDSGESWSQARVAGKSLGMLNSVHFATSRIGWAVGLRGAVVKTNNGGRFWRKQDSGTRAQLNAVHFLNNRTGWAVGEQGTVIRTRNGGTTWFTEPRRTMNALEEIDYQDGTVWVVGFGGTLLKKTAAS